MQNHQKQINRLRWKCRRGMLELDLILLGFLENHYMKLSDDQKQIFETLLDEQDPQLFEWFMGKTFPQDKRLATMIELINSHSKDN